MKTGNFLRKDWESNNDNSQQRNLGESTIGKNAGLAPLEKEESDDKTLSPQPK